MFNKINQQMPLFKYQNMAILLNNLVKVKIINSVILHYQLNNNHKMFNYQEVYGE